MFSEQKNQRECNLNKTQGVAITYSYYLNKNKLKLVKVFLNFGWGPENQKGLQSLIFFIFFLGGGVARGINESTESGTMKYILTFIIDLNLPTTPKKQYLGLSKRLLSNW